MPRHLSSSRLNDNTYSQLGHSLINKPPGVTVTPQDGTDKDVAPATSSTKKPQERLQRLITCHPTPVKMSD